MFARKKKIACIAFIWTNYASYFPYTDFVWMDFRRHALQARKYQLEHTISSV